MAGQIDRRGGDSTLRLPFDYAAALMLDLPSRCATRGQLPINSREIELILLAKDPLFSSSFLVFLIEYSVAAGIRRAKWLERETIFEITNLDNDRCKK